MLISPEPVCDCHAAVWSCASDMKTRTVYMSPQGGVFNQKKAEMLAEYDRLIIICGHYEGIDRRAIDEVVDEEISVGDYILTGGELPACILMTAFRGFAKACFLILHAMKRKASHAVCWNIPNIQGLKISAE